MSKGLQKIDAICGIKIYPFHCKRITGIGCMNKTEN